jgi:hypothetical protein
LQQSPGHAWNDTDIIEFLSFSHKSLLVGDLNAKRSFWNSVFPNRLGVELLNLLHINEFETPAPQYSTHYSLPGNGDMLEIVHKNVQLSEVIVSDILDSDHLPIVFHLLDRIRNRNISDPVNKFTDWERFQSLAYELISPKKLNSVTLVRKRTIPTERPPHVGEVSANFCG